MLILPGSSALSAFRTKRLLSQLQEDDANVTGITARYLHFIDAGAPLAQIDIDRLTALLVYGEPYDADAPAAGESFVTVPRFGTISPWASKATDIAHNCGMAHVHRIERGVAYTVQLKTGLLGGTRKLTDASIAAIAAVLHDRMTETVLRRAEDAHALFDTLDAQPLASIDILTGGKAALQAANTELGLALSDDEIDYLHTALRGPSVIRPMSS